MTLLSNFDCCVCARDIDSVWFVLVLRAEIELFMHGRLEKARDIMKKNGFMNTDRSLFQSTFMALTLAFSTLSHPTLPLSSSLEAIVGASRA